MWFLQQADPAPAQAPLLALNRQCHLSLSCDSFLGFSSVSPFCTLTSFRSHSSWETGWQNGRDQLHQCLQEFPPQGTQPTHTWTKVNILLASLGRESLLVTVGLAQQVFFMKRHACNIIWRSGYIQKPKFTALPLVETTCQRLLLSTPFFPAPHQGNKMPMRLAKHPVKSHATNARFWFTFLEYIIEFPSIRKKKNLLEL